MKKLLTLVALEVFVGGCASSAPKVRDTDLRGMYVNGYTETLAIGSGKITTIPDTCSALAAHYEEDTAWLSPSTKIHTLDLFLVGTNAVTNADGIIAKICDAFRDVKGQQASDGVVPAEEEEVVVQSSSSRNRTK